MKNLLSVFHSLTIAVITALAVEARSQTHDLVLANGRVMDPASGLDAPRHVGITAGKIAAISATPLAGRTMIDVAGHVVAPGFIDLHAHGQTRSDLEIKARDGVTTALDLEWGVYPVAAWLRGMGEAMPINFGATVSHINARFAAFHPGLEIGHWAVSTAAIAALGATPAGSHRVATAAELHAMEAALRRGLDEGALGIGFGLAYTPSATASEMEAMFRVAAERRVPAFIHVRGTGLRMIEETIETARTTGAPLHIVHVNSSGRDDVAPILALIDAHRAAGMDLTTEVYPYTAGSTLIESAIFAPGWRESMKVDYGDLLWPATGERLTAESFEKYRRQGGWVILFSMKEENIARAVAHPGVMIASDGVPFVDGKGHPRGAGTFARVLGHYSREKKLLPLMAALAKMTIFPARRLEGHVPAMRNKGRIAIGADADLTVFDPATVIDRATYTAPTTPSGGIPHVIVNGAFVVRDGRPVAGASPGRAIRSK